MPAEYRGLRPQCSQQFHSGSNPDLGFECGGHSDGETPEPIPNSEDKPVHVPYCTQVREPSGNMDRCHIHLTLIFYQTYD